MGKDWSSDLSEVQVGDWICTASHGWTRVTDIYRQRRYPIVTAEDSYTVEGLQYRQDKAPTAFSEPPEWLLKIVGPKPYEL